MTTEQDYRERLAWEVERRVELTREDIEAEVGPFECATDADARCVLSAHDGAQYVATLSGPEADARLTVEELVETDALALCNCCDVNRADERSPGGYCLACWRAALAREVCWHEEVDA